uniref:BACK domain-containing protein n=1 Tax=Glossina pallidipes TaxID=7398 RepID=A0A1B0A8B1_GLOPL
IKEFIKIWQHSVKPEDGAYTAAINWVKGDVEGRRVHLVEFMSQIRLHLVSSEFLTNHIVAEPLLSENQKCLKIIVEALTHQLRDARGQILRGGQRLHRATQQCNKEYIFLAGGTFDLVTGLKETKVYDISKKEHIRMGNMNDNRFWNSVVSLNNMVYSAGGYSGSALGTAELYNPVSKRWNYVAAMNNVRSCFGMCVCDSLIYAVGGWVTSTVEVYDPTVNEWFLLRNMPAIGNFNRTTAEEGSLYSLTRSDIYGKNKLYRFDPREGDWFHI